MSEIKLAIDAIAPYERFIARGRVTGDDLALQTFGEVWHPEKIVGLYNELTSTKQKLDESEVSLKLALTRAQCDRKDLESAQLHIKELQEALRTIAEPESNHPRFNWTGSIHLAYEDIAREALTKQPVTSALDTALLEAEIMVIERLSACQSSIDLYKMMSTMREDLNAKLAELNKD